MSDASYRTLGLFALLLLFVATLGGAAPAPTAGNSAPGLASSEESRNGWILEALCLPDSAGVRPAKSTTWR